MPRIAEFYGITIAMYYNDHEPPHLHASYGGSRVLVRIDRVYVLRGNLPRRALDMVLEWTMLHQQELRDNWERARRHEPLQPIASLE